MAYPESVYANDAEYFADIAKAYATELQVLYDNGCRNVTIDDPNLACKYFTATFLTRFETEKGNTTNEALLSPFPQISAPKR